MSDDEQGETGSEPWPAEGETEGDDASASKEPAGDDARYTPPSFMDALRSSSPFGRMTRPRPRAQPASGTEADALAVNYIDKRESIIASFLAAFEVIIGVIGYFADRKYVEHASKSAKITKAIARADTISIHHAAPWVLAINIGLGVFIAIAVLVKRRAAVGVTILLAGFGILQSGVGIVGLAYLGVGLWLVFRSMRRRTEMQAARGGAAPRAGAGRGRQGATRPASSSGAPKALPPAPERKPPTPSTRYTPPRKRKPAPPKPTGPVEPEKQSRLTAWLRK